MNKILFGNIHERVETTKKNLESIQLQIANEGFSDNLFSLEVSAHYELSTTMKMQTSEQSRIKWLEDGDRNSSIFYQLVCNKKKNNNISMLLINGETCSQKRLDLFILQKTPH